MKLMLSKLTFLLNPNRKKNLSICKGVFSTFLLMLQLHQPQPGRAVEEPLHVAVQVIPCTRCPQLMARPFPNSHKGGMWASSCVWHVGTRI